MRLMWPARSAHASTTSRVRSVEPPSTQMCSMSKLRCCSETDTSVSSIVASALSDTVMMEMNGFKWFNQFLSADHIIRGRPLVEGMVFIEEYRPTAAPSTDFNIWKTENRPEWVAQTSHTTDLRRTPG